MTEVFCLQTLIGATPRAMIFQAAMCFLLYNLIQVLRAYLAAEGARPRAEVSSEKLFWDVRDQLTTWTNLGEPEVALAALAVRAASVASVASLDEWLRATLRGCWCDKYVKAPAKRKKPPPTVAKRTRVPRGHGGHSSTWRILQAAKANRQRRQRS